MNYKILFVVADIINFLKETDIISSDGNLVMPTDPTKDTELAAGIEHILVGYGVAIPEKIDKIIAMIPLIMGLIQ